jgi:hypothetical protein
LKSVIISDPSISLDRGPDPAAAARAVLDATGRFHNPAHAAEWSDPQIDQAFEGVWALLLRGLTAKSL